MTIIYGWYSNKMKEQNIFRGFGRKKEPISNIYLTTDDKEVEVTIVSSKNENYGGANIKSFPDLIYVGELKKWIRSNF
mgnify:CR=1 FL=1